MFVPDMEGTLMELGDAPETRFRYVVWFDYTRHAINGIQEGTLLAAPNFASDAAIRRYSVLEVTLVLPVHYALQGGTGGYPGFVVEAARSASADWEDQENESTEDTTKIRVVAIPTGLELLVPETSAEEPVLEAESNMAMVGTRVHILDSATTNRVANRGIDRQTETNLTVIGTMRRDDSVDILLRIEDLYRTHFAIFGFTGVGKSNLLSTVVAKVLADAQDRLKLVFFDLMSEYTVLLLDQLLREDLRAGILTLGRYTLPENVFRYIDELTGRPPLDDAARELAGYTLLPKALVRHRALIARGLRSLLDQRRLRFFAEVQSLTVYELFFSDKTPWGKERRGRPNLESRLEVVKSVLRRRLPGGEYKHHVFTPELARLVRKDIEAALQADDKFAEDYGPILARLRQIEGETAQHHAAGVTLEELVHDLNDPGHSSLWIIQGHNPDELRSFSKRLGDEVFERRRQQGLIEPLVCFVFDEADEFIRRDATGSYAESAEIAQTLARRGRKFGLGLGIATQRIRYLDTSIMAQPHTYFISKLPRLSDRQAIAEAFGLGEDLLNQTFKFRKGEWLLASHDATGLEGVPLPIRTPDANQRIVGWLRQRYDEK